MGSLKILVDVHPHYNYMDSTICQGLQNLGHDIYTMSWKRTNYVEKIAAKDQRFDLAIDFVVDHRNGDQQRNQ